MAKVKKGRRTFTIFTTITRSDTYQHIHVFRAVALPRGKISIDISNGLLVV